MGEVCRATASKLKRDVAIKVLPAEFTDDRERLYYATPLLYASYQLDEIYRYARDRWGTR